MSEKILTTNHFENIIVERAEGLWIFDKNNKKYLDCSSGIWCCNLGHNHPDVIRTMEAQLKSIIHTNTRFLTVTSLETANKVLEFMPGSYDKITFLNSGSEAMEFGINLAKIATKRKKVLSLENSYLGAFGNAKNASYTSQSAQKLKISFPICKDGECTCKESKKQIINQISSLLSEIACFTFEPVVVSGGIIKPCRIFIQELCSLIQKNGSLIVIDEVTTGFGRVGVKFGYELYNITPDIIVLGKALGNGYPVSAIITTSKIESDCTPDQLYYSQSHQLDPLGTAVANSVVNVFDTQGIIERSQPAQAQLKKILESLSHPCIKEIRSFGMIFGIEIQPYNNKDSQELITQIKDYLLDEGIMIGISLGRNLLRLLPSLTINEKEVNLIGEKLRLVFNKLE